MAMRLKPPTIAGGKRTLGGFQQSDKSAPLVTVVTAVFNGGKTIERCIQSVLAQDYENIEHIFLDAGSKDDTLSILRSHEEHVALWVSEPDRGVYDAWNKGVKLARGEWIAFLGSDDEYLPGAISAYMKLAAIHPEADYLSSYIRWVHPAGYTRLQGGPWSWPRYSRFMCSAHVGSMHRRRLFERYGRYDLSYPMTADYEFLLRPRDGLRTAFMSVTTIRMHAGGVTDSVAALHEATRAKIEAGGRAPWIARLELAWAICKYKLRTPFNTVLFAVKHLRLRLATRMDDVDARSH